MEREYHIGDKVKLVSFNYVKKNFKHKDSGFNIGYFGKSTDCWISRQMIDLLGKEYYICGIEKDIQEPSYPTYRLSEKKGGSTLHYVFKKDFFTNTSTNNLLDIE